LKTLEQIIEIVSVLPSYIQNADIECYYEYANLFQNGLIVDLGTGWGKSMSALALANESNQIITCDPGDYPIATNWAKDVEDYTDKIIKIIDDFNLDNVNFYPETAEELLTHSLRPVNLLHMDNWSEINSIDCSKLLKVWVAKIIDGGYMIFRNYGRGDRPDWTKSVDAATEGLKMLETHGEIIIYQK
jgi:hypothetical protein